MPRLKPPTRSLRPVGEAEGGEQRGDPIVQLPAGHAVEAAEEGEVLGRAEALVERGRLGQDAGPAAYADPVDGRVQTEHLGLAGIAAQDAVEQPDRRRLAGTVVAEKAERFAGADLEREPVDGLYRAELPAETGRTDCGCCHALPATSGRLGAAIGRGGLERGIGGAFMTSQDVIDRAHAAVSDRRCRARQDMRSAPSW